MDSVQTKEIIRDPQSWKALKSQLIEHLTTENEYPKKFRRNNYYKKLSPELKKRFREETLFSEYDRGLVWHFEVFYSQEPTGLHNDRNKFDDIRELCECGFVVPLEMEGTHSTEFFPLIIDQKVNWMGDHFATLDKTPVECDLSALEEPIKYQWEMDRLIFFDSRQIHRAGAYQNKQTDYKISLNGLGYSKY